MAAQAHLAGGGHGVGGHHKKRKKEHREEWSGDRVYVQRDYTQGSRPVRFQEEVPPQLERYISQEEFADTIRKVNELYAEAEETNMTTWCEGMLGCLTAHLIFLCFSTSYDRVLGRVADLLDEENERVWMAKGLVINDPALTGLRVIEIARLDNKHKAH